MRTLALILLLSSALYSAPGDIHYVKHQQVKVYEKPDQSSKSKFILARGRKIVEINRKNGFAEVYVAKSGGLEGWIKLSDIKSTDPDGLTY